jgi:creatinine amidohydrolase
LAWRTADFSKSGVIGDASGADGALGEALFGRLVAGWGELLTNLLRSDWPPTGP